MMTSSALHEGKALLYMQGNSNNLLAGHAWLSSLNFYIVKCLLSLFLETVFCNKHCKLSSKDNKGV